MSERTCKWCHQHETIANTEDDYVTVAVYGCPISGVDESWWYHRVQVWGVGSEVIKACRKLN